MLPAPSLSLVYRELLEKPVSLAALLFAPPYSAVAKDRIVPRIGYLDERSAMDMHFFCAGYGGYGFADDASPVAEVRYANGVVIPWGFSQRKFATFVDEVEAKTKWTYSGESELIVCEPSYGFGGREPQLNWAHCLVLDLDAMVQDGAIRNPSQMIEELVRFARNRDKFDVPRSFSNANGVRLLTDFLQDGVLGLAPGAKELTKRGRHFATRNIAL